jgi:hypothetical protein
MDKQGLNQKMRDTSTLHKTVTVDKVSVFYRESGNPIEAGIASRLSFFFSPVP